MDLISKRIISIRNGQKASRREVVCFLSKSVGTAVNLGGGYSLLISALELLRREGYIRAFKFTTGKSKSQVSGYYLTIYLKYDSMGNAAIRSIFPVTTPARRVYVSARSF